MHNHDGTWDFLKLASVLGFIVLAVWWLQKTFGADVTGIALLALCIGVAIAIGMLFAHMNQKATLDALTKFNANDAKIDQYRMQTYRVMAGGEAAMMKAAARLTTIDGQQVTRLANQQAKLLTDTERAKWQAQQRQEEPASVDLWDIGDDDQGSGIQEWR